MRLLPTHLTAIQSLEAALAAVVLCGLCWLLLHAFWWARLRYFQNRSRKAQRRLYNLESDVFFLERDCADMQRVVRELEQGRIT